MLSTVDTNIFSKATVGKECFVKCYLLLIAIFFLKVTAVDKNVKSNTTYY